MEVVRNHHDCADCQCAARSDGHDSWAPGPAISIQVNGRHSGNSSGARSHLVREDVARCAAAQSHGLDGAPPTAGSGLARPLCVPRVG